MNSIGEFEARLAQGHALAPELVGLDREAALGLASGHGFDAEAIPPDAVAVNPDLSANRIRLKLDANDIVVQAWAG